MTELLEEAPEPIHALYFVTRDGDSGTYAESSEDMTEIGVPGVGWPDPPMLRVTKDFYDRWEQANQELASKVLTEPDPNDYLRPTAGDVLEPYKY